MKSIKLMIKTLKNKRFVYIILIIVALLVLTACSGGGDGGGDGDGGGGGDNGGQEQGRTYDLIWWNLFEDQEKVQPLIDRYQSLNPNVNIRYVQKTSGLEEGNLIENYVAELDANLTDNEQLNTPDIITINHTWVGKYQPRLTASSVITASDIESDFYPVVSQDFVRKENVYGVPLYMDSLALIANTDLMANISAVDSSGPVDNWFDFLDQARRVTVRDGNNIEVAGFAGGLENVEYLPEVLSTIMLQNNIQMTRKEEVSDFAAEAVFADDPEAQLVLDSYRSYTSAEPTWSSSFDSEVASFLSEELVMFIAPSWRLNDILKLRDLYDIDIQPEIYPIPQIDPTSNDISNWADYWGLAVTQDSQSRGQSQQAWDFIQFLTESEQLRSLNENINEDPNRYLDIIYPRVSMSESQRSDPFLGEYVRALETAESWDMIDGFTTKRIIRNSFGDTQTSSVVDMQNEINSQVILQRTTLLSNE